MTINAIMPPEPPVPGKAGAGQSPGNSGRVRAELQQNLPVAESAVLSTKVALPAEHAEPVGDKRASSEDIAQAVKAINQQVQALHRELQFSVDDKSGRVIIKIVDTQTKQVIRQIPAEDVVELARDLPQDRGLILKTKA